MPTLDSAGFFKLTVPSALGGHAYSAYNAISGLIGDFAVVTTGGGDNTILAQQCARYLISSVKRASEGKPLGKSVRYLKDVEADSPRVFKAMHPHELRDSTNQLSALAWLSHKMVTTAGMTLASLLGSGSDMNDAWNNHMVELIESIRPHSLYYAVKTFVAAVESMRHNEKLYNVLSKVSSLFALVSMKQCAQHFLEHGYMTPEQVKLIRQEIVVICRELRPDGVALVDAFNYPDWLIKAPLGQADGNIYEAYLNNVKEGNPPGNTSYYWREIAPQLHSKM
jgi:acyl-CoA oxidase